MPDLYPFLIQPEFHERIWGTRDLAPYYTRQVTGDPIGEAWLTSDAGKVANGPLTGLTLAAMCRRFGARLLGDMVEDQSRFPLLIKFLFPQDKLSVQVHPDDAVARQMGEPCGKTECWYVLSAQPGAQIGLGLKPGTTKPEVERAIREKHLEQLLNWIEVRAGDMFYVEAGTVHAIGPDVVIVETQQNSDTTYRLYDYGRPRELHIGRGLLAVKEETHAGRVAIGMAQEHQGKVQMNLITSPSFIVDKFAVVQPWQFQRPKHSVRSVWCLVATRGCAVMEAEGAAPLTLSAGEAVVVPAAVERFILKPQWDVEFLCASLPVEPVEHPKTSK